MEEEKIHGKEKETSKIKQTLKRRFADARNHKSIIECKYKNKTFNDKQFIGNISLLEIKKVKDNWYVDEEQRCILAKDYHWLEIYPQNKNYCITAIFNENKQLIELYIDIARELGIEDGVPYEDDLYLDVVIVADGRKNLLDEDELQEAYQKNIINKEEYDMAYEVANKLLQLDEENVNKLIDFSYEYLKLLEK